MQRFSIVWIGFLAVVCWTGCNNSDPAQNQTSPEATAAAEPEYKHPPEQAAKVVSAFLSAIKHGDEAGARALLTVVAQEQTAAIGMEIAPSWNEGASYEVGEVEVQENGVAHVGCVLKDAEESLNIIWALRAEKEDWRVAGLATRVSEDEDPMILDYEQPDAIVEQFDEMESGQAAATDEDAPAEDTAASDDTDSESPVKKTVDVDVAPDEDSPPPREARRGSPKRRPAVEDEAKDGDDAPKDDAPDDSSDTEIPHADDMEEPTEPRRIKAPPKRTAPRTAKPAPVETDDDTTSDDDGSGDAESDAAADEPAEAPPPRRASRPSSTRRK